MFSRKFLALKVKNLENGEYGFIDPDYIYTDSTRNVVVYSETLTYENPNERSVLYFERSETGIRVYAEDLISLKISFREIVIDSPNNLPVELED